MYYSIVFLRCLYLHNYVSSVDNSFVTIAVFPGTASTPISGAPPSVLSPTPVAGFPMAQANGQAQELYANGIPAYTGSYIFCRSFSSNAFVHEHVLFINTSYLQLLNI